MSKVISFRDILKASWLSGYTETQLLSIERDDEVNRVLGILGFDVEYAIEYNASYHRDLTGKVAVGFTASGEVQHNRSHLASQLATLTDILVVAAHRDPSLSIELGTLTGLSRNYSPATESGFDEHKDYYMSEVLAAMSKPDRIEWERHRKDITDQVFVLEKLRDQVRGPVHNAAGSLKTTDEYKAWHETQTL